LSTLKNDVDQVKQDSIHVKADVEEINTLLEQIVSKQLTDGEPQVQVDETDNA